MATANSCVQCVPGASGSYRIYGQSRLIGEAAPADDGGLRVVHSFTGSGGAVASLREAVAWLTAMEDAVAEPLALA